MSEIKQETKFDHEAQPDTGDEDIVQARKTNVVPKLTCIVCNGFYRGSVRYCKNNHGVCSACLPGDRKQCPVTGCGQIALVTLDFLAELVKELKLPIACKFKKDGCNQENADEEVIADHEIECGYRKVPCLSYDIHCPEQPAMELEAHLISAHYFAYGKFRDNPGKWFLNEMGDAYKMWIDSESGLRFEASLYHNEEKEQWRCYTRVFGGENVAKKFRAEMRLSSYEGDTTLIFNCNVLCLDDWLENEVSKEFCIDEDQFKIYNRGHLELGDHNKDKNGELTMPVTIEVKMKKLNVG